MDYETAVENFYRSTLRKGDHVLDCGAHSGRHTVPISNCVGPMGRVYAFEPLPTAFSLLKKNLDKNNTRNAILYNSALGEYNGTTDFVFVPEFPEYSGLKKRVYHDQNISKEIITVNIMKMDDLEFEDTIKYIKIDAEGGDLLILRGGRNYIEKNRPFVSFELGDNSIIEYEYESVDFYDFFEEMDYEIFTITGERLSRRELVESSRVQKLWDYVAVPFGADIREWNAAR